MIQLNVKCIFEHVLFGNSDRYLEAGFCNSIQFIASGSSAHYVINYTTRATAKMKAKCLYYGQIKFNEPLLKPGIPK